MERIMKTRKIILDSLVDERTYGCVDKVGKKTCTIENHGDVRLSRCYHVESYFGSRDVSDLIKRTQHAFTILNLRRAAMSMLKSSTSTNVPASQLLKLVKYFFAKGDYDISAKLATSLDPSVAAVDGVAQLLACTEDVKKKEESSILVDSVHPHITSNEVIEYSGRVQISGARALKLEFDSRSALTHRSRLEIHDSNDDLIRAFVGSSFGTVVVYVSFNESNKSLQNNNKQTTTTTDTLTTFDGHSLLYRHQNLHGDIDFESPPYEMSFGELNSRLLKTMRPYNLRVGSWISCWTSRRIFTAPMLSQHLCVT